MQDVAAPAAVEPMSVPGPPRRMSLPLSPRACRCPPNPQMTFGPVVPSEHVGSRSCPVIVQGFQGFDVVGLRDDRSPREEERRSEEAES